MNPRKLIANRVLRCIIDDNQLKIDAFLRENTLNRRSQEVTGIIYWDADSQRHGIGYLLSRRVDGTDMADPLI